MKHFVTGVCLLCLFGTSACDTVLGPPGSEPQLPAPPQVVSPPYDMFAEGEPNPGTMVLKGGLYLWKTGNIWNLRVARTDMPNVLFRDVFTGTIQVEHGFAVNVEKENASPPDDVRADISSIFFKFEVQRELKGLRFRVQPVGGEYCINLDVQINGMPDPRYVYLGRSMFPPNTLPLRMCFRQ